MKIRFIGPIGKVTGSCTWMRDQSRDWSFLIDCGMQQGERSSKEWNSCNDWPFKPKELQFVILTHAHIDHSGLIPALYKQGFNGTVFCTEETRDIAKLLLSDAARFPGSIYSEHDLDKIKWHTPTGKTTFGGYHPVADDLFIRFHRTGHIIGSVSVTVAWGAKGIQQKSIIFSGDIGPGVQDREVLPFLRFPLHPKPGNFAVIESTYGNIIREDEDRNPAIRRARLAELLDQIIESKGTLALPAFAVGRTQDLIFDLHHIVAENPNRYHQIRFLLDSPTAYKVNEITLEALRKVQTNKNTGTVRPLWLGKQLLKALELDKTNPDHLDYVQNVCEMALGNHSKTRKISASYGNSISQAWKGIFTTVSNRKLDIKHKIAGPRVVIMSSGMADGGPASSWLPALLKSKKNIVAMSGYCGVSTIGGQLLELKGVSADQRLLHTGELEWKQMNGTLQSKLKVRDIQAKIVQLSGYSAHADQVDLLNWIFEEYRGKDRQVIAPTVFVQHGENHARNGLASAIKLKADEWDTKVSVNKPNDPSVWLDLECDEVNQQDQQRKDQLKDGAIDSLCVINWS